MSDGAAGRTLLRRRVASLPDALARLAARPPEPALDVAGARRIVVTGVGSSGAHARFLAGLLADELALPTRFLPVGAFPKAHRRAGPDDLLVVFSQGLSPNARPALAAPAAWRATVLVTAVEGASPEATRRQAALRDAGVRIVEGGGGAETGALVRVVGPLTATWAALRLAEAMGWRLPAGADAAVSAVREALTRGEALAATLGDALLRDALLLLASGSHAEGAENLRLKLAEGLLRPVPPVCELLAFAHGPFQRLFPARAHLLALTRADAGPDEEERLQRLTTMLAPGRHVLHRLPARLPGPLALLEHEVLLDALLLGAVEAAALDPTDWPGRGRDEPLYGLGRDAEPPPRPAHAPTAGAAGAARLAALTWPELAGRLARGARTAVLPLGSTEQHGPHLPFATDTWIADAVAARVARALPTAVALPALPLGCASEHLAFPGTLSLEEDTLAAVLADVLRSLARHGFERVLGFSAHGGNLGLLRRRRDELARAAAPARWVAFTDASGLEDALAAVAAGHGVARPALGAHAGELETSVIASLAPGAVRREALAVGRLAPAPPGEDLFYPDLRRHAPEGVVGDPRDPDPARAEAYLTCWADHLVAFYRSAFAARDATKGTKPA